MINDIEGKKEFKGRKKAHNWGSYLDIGVSKSRSYGKKTSQKQGLKVNI